MNNTFITTNGIRLSPRSRLVLTREEMDQLREYTENDPAAFRNIKENASIRRDTIVQTLERGWITVAPALRLRKFLKDIKNAKL